jgi:hypothetical protein
MVFCSDKCRIRYNSENRNCFYCGVRGTARDHIYPVAERSGFRRFGGQETVRVCTECNGLLGSRFFESITERCQYVADHLFAKYNLGKTAVDWQDWEIEELGPLLQRRIKKALALRAKREMRYRFALAMVHLTSLEDCEIVLS